MESLRTPWLSVDEAAQIVTGQFGASPADAAQCVMDSGLGGQIKIRLDPRFADRGVSPGDLDRSEWNAVQVDRASFEAWCRAWSRHRAIVLESLERARKRNSLPPDLRRLHKLAALQCFREDLKKARALFEMDKPSGQSVALHAVADFLDSLDPDDPGGFQQLFLSLAHEMADHDRKGNATPIARKGLDVQIASLIDALVERYDRASTKKERREKAAHEVVSILERYGVDLFGHPGTPTWKVVLNLRQNISNAKRTDTYQLYKHFRKEDRDPAVPPSRLLAAFSEYLERLGWRRR